MAQVKALVGGKENGFADTDATDTPAPQISAPAGPAAANSVTTIGQAPAARVAGDTPAEPAAPSRSRRKEGRVALLLVIVLVACFAWYPLSDHHAPFASSASITADVTQIAARVAGPVTAVSISDNAEVTAGQPLFSIDDTTYRMDVELAKAQLQQVLNTVNSSVASIPGVNAKLEQAQLALNTSNDDLDRARQLAEKGLVAPAKLSAAESAQRSAALNVEAAEIEIERLTMSIGAIDDNNPNVRTARANLEKAEFALTNTTVVAPADGYVTNLSLTHGQFVGAGTAVLTFINPASQMVIADFRENQLINVEPGDSAVVTFEAAPGRQFAGIVDSVAWGISAGRTSVNGLSQPTSDTRWFPPARKIPVRIKLDDLSELPANVRLGSEAGVLIVPDDGIIPAIAKTLLSLGGLTAGLN
ncbi:MAG: HlyD family secretion protein [Devosia sp.]